MLEVPSTVGGLAFAPKGLRLAIAHYNGVTLWFPNAQSRAGDSWNGRARISVSAFSPDGQFLVTAMQEPTLHGWRLADRQGHADVGLLARACARSAGPPGGKWLATSGSTQLILWPFQTKDGPMGKTPRILAPVEAQAEVVACHPKQEVVAVGYADGLVLLVRIEDGAEILARKPGAAPVTALAWNATGKLLAFGTEDGEAWHPRSLGPAWVIFSALRLLREVGQPLRPAASALSGSRFQVWLRPNSEMPRYPRTSSFRPSGLSVISAR